MIQYFFEFWCSHQVMIKTGFALNISKTTVSCKNTLNVLAHRTTVFIILIYSILF